MIGIFLAPVYPIINSTFLTQLPKSKHPIAASLIVIFSALGGSVGSVLTGVLFEHQGGIRAFYYSLIPMAMLLLALLYYYKSLRKHGN